MSGSPDDHQGGASSNASGLNEAVRRRGSLLGTIKAVAWSFFGVRHSGSYDQDISQLNPVHVIIAGILGAVVFVIALLLLVDWVVSSGVMA